MKKKKANTPPPQRGEVDELELELAFVFFFGRVYTCFDVHSSDMEFGGGGE